MPTTVSSVSELVSAVDSASSGDTVVVRDGTYQFDSQWQITTNGVTIEAEDGARPMLRGPGRESGDGSIKVYGENVTVRGFEIAHHGFKGIFTARGHGSTFEDLVAHDNWHTGIMNNGSRNVTFRNCDSYNNYGNNQDADGFNTTGNSNNMARDNLIVGCRAWNNADDGYDMFASEDNTIRNCWSWNNGRGGVGNGNGFKLGRTDPLGGGHLVENCVAWDNKVDNSSYSPGSGFWWNGEDDNTITVRNCTAWGNGIDFRFEDIGHTLENNIAVGNNVTIGDAVNEDCNTWNLGIDDPQLASQDPTSSDFARLASGSACIGAGMNGGDLGAYPSDAEPEDGDAGTVKVDGQTTLVASAAKTQETTLQREHSGFNDEGYLNFRANEGAAIGWPLEMADTGTYNYSIRYANGGSERTATMSVGGSEGEITFPSTEGWVEWSTVTGTIDIQEASTDLIIETTGDDAGNVDQITLEPAQERDDSDGGSEPSGDTPLHGYATPEAGQSDWHVPINENFEAIDRDVPVVDTEQAKADYDAVDGTLFIAMDTGAVYVGDGAEWNSLGTLS